MKITDHFKMGDQVEWITVRQIGSAVEIKRHEGVIDEIIGSKAMIKSPEFKHRKRVSLFELKVV